MSYLIGSDLVAHLRTWGLTVAEDKGWQQRMVRPFPAKPQVIVCHHTGTADKAPGDYPTRNVIVNGRSDLPGPLAQFGLGRSGAVYLFAAGICNHAGKGTWDGIDVGNSHSIGIEAESAGGGHWTPAQLHAYPLLAAALCDYFGIAPKRVCAHRESARPAGRKDDPVGIDMPTFRRQVTQLLQQHTTPTKQPAKKTAPAKPTPTSQEDRMLVRFQGNDAVYETVGSHLEHVTAEAFHARGIDPKAVKDLPATHALAKLERR